MRYASMLLARLAIEIAVATRDYPKNKDFQHREPVVR